MTLGSSGEAGRRTSGSLHPYLAPTDICRCGLLHLWQPCLILKYCPSRGESQVLIKLPAMFTVPYIFIVKTKCVT